MTDNKQIPLPPLRSSDEAAHRMQLAQAIHNILNGKLYCSGSITLTANQASTVVTDRRIGNDSVILFMPITANAATELYGATMYVTAANIDPINRQFTITHANNAQTDRNFRYIIIG